MYEGGENNLEPKWNVLIRQRDQFSGQDSFWIKNRLPAKEFNGEYSCEDVRFDTFYFLKIETILMLLRH